MNSRANRSFGRSMIPNYAISEVPSTPKKTKRKKSTISDFPSFGSDKYKESMEVVDKSKQYDKQVSYLVMAVIGILIILALAPICIVILKKWRWRWLARIFDITYIEDQPAPSVIPTYTGSSVPTVMSSYPTTHVVHSSLPVNPTGGGIDINKPYVIPSSALKTYTSTEL